MSLMVDAKSVCSNHGDDSSHLNGLKVSPSFQDETIRSFLSQQKILRPFFTDGCSLSPDGYNPLASQGGWVQCCVEHDYAYWKGGSSKDKNVADKIFNVCLQKFQPSLLAKIYTWSVERAGGGNFSIRFRWGYGWLYQRGDNPLSSDELFYISLLENALPSEIENFLTFYQKYYEDCPPFEKKFGQLNQIEFMIYNYLIEKSTRSFFINQAIIYPDPSGSRVELFLSHCLDSIWVSLQNEKVVLVTKSDCQL